MGMLVFVYRNTMGDCTNQGVSQLHDQLVVQDGDGPFEPSNGNGMILRMASGRPILVPAELADRHTMMGGNYAGTSDSRWSRQLIQLCGYNPGVVAVHDRVE